MVKRIFGTHSPCIGMDRQSDDLQTETVVFYGRIVSKIWTLDLFLFVVLDHDMFVGGTS